MKTIVTHSGTFHPDEIFAVAAWLEQHKLEDFRILRTRDPQAIAKADIAIDVGGIYDPEKLRFDHHQFGKSSSNYGTSAFGLVMDHLGLSGSPFEELIRVVDARDTRVGYEEVKGSFWDQVCEQLSDLNQLDLDSESQESAFYKALWFATDIIVAINLQAEEALEIALEELEMASEESRKAKEQILNQRVQNATEWVHPSGAKLLVTGDQLGKKS